MRWLPKFSLSPDQQEELFAVVLVVMGFAFCFFVFVLFFPSHVQAAEAQAAPRAALKYRADLVRVAHAEWGLDAPIAAMAAQIHQESGWNPAAMSHVGAIGLTQFMPATAAWMKQAFPALAIGQPTHPVWAMLAMVTYDRWLFNRVSGESEADKYWAALRSYNGGLGHWQAEAALARPKKDRGSIDAACGKAKRSPLHCQENLAYPRRILTKLQQLYLRWGRGVAL